MGKDLRRGRPVTTAGYQNLRNIFRADYDSHDAWGSVLGFLFPIAELLYVEEEDVPSAWEFRPSPFLTRGMVQDDSSDSMRYYLSQDYLSGYFTANDLVSFGNVLHRYSTNLRTAGKDY